MRSYFRRTFIPNEKNDYVPNFFRERAILALSALVVLFFFVSIFEHSLLHKGEVRSAVIIPVLVELANSDRVKGGAGELTVSPLLSEAARRKAEDMAARGYFAHQTPDGRTPWSFMEEVGYRFTHAGENLAVNFSDSDEVERAWMESPTHRANILNESFTEMGIGTAVGTYEGRSSMFVVQMFGRPAKEEDEETKVTTFVEVAENGESTTLPNRVMGEATTSVSSDSDFIATEERETYIALIGGKESEVTITPSGGSIKSTSAKVLNIFGRIFTSPKVALQFAYIALASIVGIALLLFIFIEFRRQSPIHIGYTALLLLLIASLWFFQETYVFTELVVR